MTDIALPEKASLPALMGLRFILSLWVLASHLSPIIGDFFKPPELLYLFLNSGFYAVDIFFMLSGIIITHHYGEVLKHATWRVYGAFLWLRIARLYPVHVFTLLIALAMMVSATVMGRHVNNPSDFTLVKFIENLILVQAWHYDAVMSWNRFAWSISAEWFAYIITPILLLLFSRRFKTGPAILLCLALFSILPIFHVFHLFVGGISSPLIRVVTAFSVGIIIYHSLRHLNMNELTYFITILLFVAIVLIETILNYKNFGLALWPGLFILTTLLQADDTGHHAIGRMLRTPVLQYAGHLAYALYMVQFVALAPLFKFFPHDAYISASLMTRMLYLCMVIGVVMGATIVTYHCVEQPARAWLRQRNPFTR